MRDQARRVRPARPASEASADGLRSDERAEFPNLHSDYDAPAYEVVSSIFTALTKKKNVTPSGNFQSSDGQQAIKCNCACTDPSCDLTESAQ